MAEKFDIIEYISGFTGFVFDKAVLKRIALDRGIYGVESYSDLTKKDKDLVLADMLFTVLISPNTMASSSHAHGSYSQSIGSQVITEKTKEDIRNQIQGIYEKYDDEKLSELETLDSSTLQWLDY